METVPNENLVALPTDLPKEIPSSFSENTHNNYHDVKTLLSWSAPARPFKKRGKQFYTTSLLVALFLEIILFLFSQYIFMFVVASLVFLGFAFALVPPRNFHYKISNQGVRIEDHFYLWQELYDFFFREDTLYIRTEAFIPGELVIPLGDVHKDQVRGAMLPYLPYREFVKPTFMETSASWLSKNFPLERAS